MQPVATAPQSRCSATCSEAERAPLAHPNVPRWHAVLTIIQAQALCDVGALDAVWRLPSVA